MRTLFFVILLTPLFCISQQTEVSGTVLSKEGPLLGVSVVEKGTTNGTTTDFKGKYAISVKSGATLVFSYLGFATQELTVNGNTIDITLQEDAQQLDDVVVQGFGGVVGRARRRAESVQSIPESVVTFTSEAIETKGITNIESFSDQIPNVNFTTSQNIGNNFITVRGISHIRNGESPIAFVIDGVTLPDPNLINQELFDLALIEVVKGPQGALYGRNAIAGAINIVTNEPTNTSRNKIDVGYANGNTFRAQISSTGPLVKDKFFYRISGTYKKGDGLFNNETLNTAPDFIEDLSVRAQLKANLSSTVSATLTGQLIDAEAGAVYYASPNNGSVDAAPDDFGVYSIQGDQLGRSTLDGLYGNLKVDFNLKDVKLTSSTSYNKGERNHVGDLDFTPLDILRQDQDSNTETINQELRLSSLNNSDSKITWDVGGFYQKLDKLLTTEVTADFGFFAPPFEPSGVQSLLAIGDFTNTYNTIAAFGFVDFKVSDRLTLSAGLRYDNDKIEQDDRNDGSQRDKTDSQLQPKVSIAFNATENILMYANYGRGYRAGGFNQGESPRYNRDYNAEFTNNYEIGMKNSFWDDRFILNLSGFYIDFSDQQLYALLIDGSNINIGIFNAAKSESVGFEADLKLRTSNWLDVLASYGVSKSRIEEGTSALSSGQEISLNNTNTPFIPQDSYSFGLESNFDINDKISFNGNVNLEGTGKIYWHEGNEGNANFSSGYSLLNARLGFTFNKLTFSFWGRNITDNDYITEYSAAEFSGGGSDIVWFGQPATYGVNASYKF